MQDCRLYFCCRKLKLCFNTLWVDSNFKKHFFLEMIWWVSGASLRFAKIRRDKLLLTTLPTTDSLRYSSSFTLQSTLLIPHPWLLTPHSSLGGAAEFRGGYLRIRDFETISITDQLTVSLWTNIEAASADCGVFYSTTFRYLWICWASPGVWKASQGVEKASKGVNKKAKKAPRPPVGMEGQSGKQEAS